MKKFLALVLALVMTMSLVTISAGAKDFDDAADITYTEAVDVMSALKVVDGDAAGNFNPTAGLTRGAAAKIICNLILGPTTAAALNADTNPYVDVDKDSVFAGYIAYCAKEGIVSGYADGTFKPANPLTGYAFLKMLLGALGYDAAVEGYTGENWSINVAKQALGIGLNADLLAPVNDSDMITREVAMLYAFNTLKATMVDYDTTITIGDVTVAGSNEYDVANNGKNETIADDNKMQFAEKYFSKLVMKDDVDAFERPATTWVNGKETVGTYVNYATMIAEYTEGVAGNELANVIGKTALKDYDFYCYIDGIAADLSERITKNNKDDYYRSGNGVLTQVFVDNDKEEVVITQINTYLAQATIDYNAKKDTVSYKVYVPGMDGQRVAAAYPVAPSYPVVAVDGEDFDIADVEKDDFARVTCTWDADFNPVIETIDEVEVIADTEIEKFSTNSSLTIDGEKYSYDINAEYDYEVLEQYTTAAGVKNLKDTTYNVYVDQYGYVLGVDIVSTPDDFVFITGVDSASSNLANKPWTANAIFMDGTSKVIEVKKGAETFAFAAEKNYDIINSWFKFTVDKNDQYTLSLVYYADSITDVEEPASKTAQWWDNETAKIDAKHISVEGIDETVYGNASTIYMLAELDTVNGQKVITGTDEVVTGVKNAAFETIKYTDLCRVYPLYKNTGYVIAAVVVGESATVASDYAYFLNRSVDSESYDKVTGEWTWTRTAIIDGEEVVLKEVNDTGVSYLKEGIIPEGDVNRDTDWGFMWVEVKYDANGNVKKIVPAAFEDCIADAVVEIQAGEEVVLLEAEDDPESDDATNTKQHTLKGNTLYDMTDGKKGVLVAEDVKVVLYQEVKNVWETDCSEGVEVLEAILDNLNEELESPNHDLYWYYVAAVIEDGIITSIIVIDEGDNGAYDGPEAGNGSAVDAVDVELVGAHVFVTFNGPADATDVADAIQVAMDKAGYSKVTVDLLEGEVTAEKEGQALKLGIVFPVVIV